MDTNYFTLAWFLLTRTRPFNLHAAAHMKYFRLLPGRFMKVLRVFIIMKKLLSIKNKKSKRKKEIINVPYDGHILIKTSNGYKIFNLKKKIVATHYKSDIKNDIFINIIKNLGIIEEFAISPKIKAVDYHNKCVYEEYINLYKSKIFYPIKPYFYNIILPTWEKNIKIYPSRRVSLTEYVVIQKSFILNRIEYLEKERYDKEIIVGIRGFVEKLSKKILLEHNQTCIYLTLSHGDFHAWNVLIGNKEAILIDWDTLKERSLYHDLFYIFIHNIFGKDNVNYNEFLLELDKCISMSGSKFQNGYKDDHLTHYTSLDKDLYRMLFYLEYIYLDFERRLDMCTDRKRIKDRAKQINHCIKVFEEIEMNINAKNLLAN